MNDLLTKAGYTRAMIEEAFEKSGRRNPVIKIGNTTYVLGTGINDCDLSDVITEVEMKNRITKICFNPSRTKYYVVGPDYYENNISNLDKFSWIGERKSKLKTKELPIKFGFGRGKTPLIQYDFE